MGNGNRQPDTAKGLTRQPEVQGPQGPCHEWCGHRKKGGRGVGVVKPHGRGEPCVWAEELRGWRRSLQDAPRGGKELETVEGRGSAPMRAGPRRGEGGEGGHGQQMGSAKQRGKKHMWATLMETSEPQEWAAAEPRA
jgi:hypothetical protein